MRLREQQDLSGAPLADLLPRLEAAAAGAVAPAPAHAAPSEPPSPEPPPAAPAAPPAATEAPPDTRPASPTVRISAERLDDLLARAGELLVARRRVESRAGDVAELLALVAQ